MNERPSDPFTIREAAGFLVRFAEYSRPKMRKQDLSTLHATLRENLRETQREGHFGDEDPVPGGGLEYISTEGIIFHLLAVSKAVAFTFEGASEVLDAFEIYSRQWIEDEGPLGCRISYREKSRGSFLTVAAGYLSQMSSVGHDVAAW